MGNQTGYKKQQSLSFAQFLAETPSFFAVLISAILSKTLLVFVDLLDSFGTLLRTGMVCLLSKKLSRDLQFEYNYGIGKIEAIASLVCDAVVFFGLLLTLGLSVYSIINPERPSDLVIAVVGLKIINVSFDTAFFIKQNKILKLHKSAIAETNFAAALAALLFDSVTLISLLAIWLMRNNPIGAYISPVISIFIVIYLMYGCIKRTKAALFELTDKTLPEKEQMQILGILARYSDRYLGIYSVNSKMSASVIYMDLHLSFPKDTKYEEIISLKEQMQKEFDKQFDSYVLNIIAEG